MTTPLSPDPGLRPPAQPNGQPNGQPVAQQIGQPGGSGDETREDVLLASFVSLARGLASRTVPDALRHLLDRSVPLLGAKTAGLLLSRDRGPAQVLTDSGAQDWTRDLLDPAARDSPCRDSLRTGETVLVDDLPAAVAQWPSWGPTALEHGVRSVHAFPRTLRGTTTGSFTLLGDRPRRLDTRDRRAAQALADFATITVATDEQVRRAEELTAQLQTALDSRIVIEQAKGVVAASLGVSVDEAFVVMRDHARSTNRRLVDLAGDLSTGRTGVDVLGRRPRSAPDGRPGEDPGGRSGGATAGG